MEQPVAHPDAEHLCVLVHGLWGNPNHLANIAKVLREKHPEENLHLLVAKRNSGSFTYDGVELGGERVCLEIEDELEKLEQAGQTIKKLSIVGYSLGGLVARYAVGLLYSRGVFNKVEPVNFTTFATPHLGVRTPLRGWHSQVWNVFGARTLSMSGKQLFLIDNFRNIGRPLLSVLADPDSGFMKGLAMFKRRTLYTNIVNDRSAVYYTTGISKTDPFTDLEKIQIKYIPGYEDIVLDPVEPYVLVEPVTAESSSVFTRLISGVRTYLKHIPLMLAFALFIPVGTVVFLITAVFQTRWSTQRIRLHEAGKAGIKIGMYRSPLLIGMREAVEETYEHLNSAQDNEYLLSGHEEEALDGDHQTASWRDRSESPVGNSAVTKVSSLEKPGSSPSQGLLIDTMTIDEPVRLSAELSDIPMLALTPEQFAMIQALDDVGWRKYPVHIHKVRHSHAAMIVRMNRQSFSEGYIILRHWVEEEFLME